ncbi:MAG TPA: transglycosylase SLT domain-containing protein [Burkholderiaceae bacterium]|jgi:soluble lytic murein transglycosylase-like protein
MRRYVFALILAAGQASAQVPTLTLESLPRPATPPAEVGPVVPAQVERWRQEGEAAENGDGQPRDPVLAAQLYCRAARYGDAVAQYNLAWMLTNGRGIRQNDAEAAHLFAAAAEQGIVQAENMAKRLGTPLGPTPPCLRPPEADAVTKPQAAKSPRTSRTATGFVTLPPPANAPAVIVRFVDIVAPDYKLSPSLVLALMATESNFDPLAVSNKNAQGLMQLLPDTALRFKVTKLTDPTQNIRGGMAYLRWLLAYYQGDLPLVLAAYNAGEKAVDRYHGVPPYAETRNYVRLITARLAGQYWHPFDASIAEPSPIMAR